MASASLESSQGLSGALAQGEPSALDQEVEVPSTGRRDKSGPLSGTDYIAGCVEVMVKKGFAATGQAPLRVTYQKLLESGAIENYKQALDQDMADCEDMDVVAILDEQRKKLQSADGGDWSCRVGIAQGCAGSGKTTGLLACREAFPRRAIILVHSTHLLTTVYRGVSGVYTPLDFVTRVEDFSEPHIFLVDEYTKIHMCSILVCAMLAGARSVLLFGDPLQGLSHKAGSELHYSFPVLVKSDTCHRLPSSGVDFLNKVTGGRMKGGANAAAGQVANKSWFDSLPDHAVALAFTPESVRVLSEDLGEVILVDDAQGCTFEYVALYIRHCDLEAMSDPSRLEVALTRQSETLDIRCEDANLYSKLVNRMISSCCKHKSTTQV